MEKELVIQQIDAPGFLDDVRSRAFQHIRTFIPRTSRHAMLEVVYQESNATPDAQYQQCLREIAVRDGEFAKAVSNKTKVESDLRKLKARTSMIYEYTYNKAIQDMGDLVSKDVKEAYASVEAEEAVVILNNLIEDTEESLVEVITHMLRHACEIKTYTEEADVLKSKLSCPPEEYNDSKYPKKNRLLADQLRREKIVTALCEEQDLRSAFAKKMQSRNKLASGIL